MEENLNDRREISLLEENNESLNLKTQKRNHEPCAPKDKTIDRRERGKKNP